MRSISKLMFVLVVVQLVITGCTINRGVNSSNEYYSEMAPSLKVSIPSNLIYSPEHPVAKEHNAELFLDKQNNESIFIKIYSGNYDPSFTFNDKRMYQKSEKTISGLRFHVGTEIEKENDIYYLRRVFIHYPNNNSMLVIMHVSAAKNFGYGHNWSTSFDRYTDDQKEIVDKYTARADKDLTINAYIKKETKNTYSRLEELKKLYDNGLITKEEYDIKRKQLVDGY